MGPRGRLAGSQRFAGPHTVRKPNSDALEEPDQKIAIFLINQLNSREKMITLFPCSSREQAIHFFKG
jgi:hypothetical protein